MLIVDPNFTPSSIARSESFPSRWTLIRSSISDILNLSLISTWTSLSLLVKHYTIILNDDKYFEQIKVNCFEKSNKFDWHNTAVEIENLYKSVLI